MVIGHLKSGKSLPARADEDARCRGRIEKTLLEVETGGDPSGQAREIYVLGRVQAIAATALGTETIASVDMLVGPGPSGSFAGGGKDN